MQLGPRGRLARFRWPTALGACRTRRWLLALGSWTAGVERWLESCARAAARDAALDDALRPLADRMRPRTLDEFVGQEQLLGARQAAAPGDRARAAALADPLGAAGHRQDHAGAPDRAARRTREFIAALGGDGRREGHPRGGRAGARGARASAAGRPCCSSTRCIASTRRSRTRSCRTSRTAR